MLFEENLLEDILRRSFSYTHQLESPAI